MPLFRARNLLLLLALLLAVVMAAIVATRYRPSVEVLTAARSLPVNVEAALQDIRYTHTEGDVPRWRLFAKQVERQVEGGVTTVGDLQVTFFDPKGAEQGTLMARSGVVNSDFTEIAVRDQVVVTSRRGYTLNTERMIFRQADRTVSTDAPVSLTAGGLQVNGTGMVLDLGTQKMKFLGGVRAVIDPARRTRE